MIVSPRPTERANTLGRTTVMKVWKGTMAAVTTAAGLTMVLPAQAHAQSSDWEDFGDRIAAAIEDALDAAADALASMDFDFEFDFDMAYAGEASGPTVDEEFRWSGPVDRGDVLEIKNVNGSIRAVLGDGDAVEVFAVKSGRRNSPSEVRIEVIEHAGGVTLCAVYPTPRGEEANECGVGEDGRSSVRRNDVSVVWEVRVPRGVDFRARNVNGSVEAEGLDGHVDAATVNGNVELATSGFASARSVNGSIRAALGSHAAEDADFQTVNGSISLDLRDDFNGDLDASWVAGSLETELPLAVDGRIGRRSARGTFGDGGATLRINTVNGSIRIY
jgi:hypothetical protein